MKKKLIAALAATLATSMFVGCTGGSASNSGTSQEATGSAGVKEITIPHYKVGQNVGAKFFVPQVDRFNEKYEGQYKINLEEIPQDAYAEKIKQLAQQDKLPILIEGGDADWLKSYVIPNNKYYDLAAFIESKPEVKNVLIPEALAYNTTEDGKVVSMPLAVSRPMGMFYNTTMFSANKNIADMTMDEFLTAVGDNKLALMTSENAWTTMLLFTSLVAMEEGGTEVLINGVTEKVTDFNTPVWINAVAKLQDIAKKYGAANSLGAAYADAANGFMSKNAAVIFNGPWMTGDFTSESSDKWSNGFDGSQVGASVFPGNIAVDNVQIGTWWIPANAKEADVEVALAFLEFMYSQDELEKYMLFEGGVAPNMEQSEAFITAQKENALLYQLNSAVTDKTAIVPAFEHVVPSSIASQEFGKLLPKLFDGSYTPEQFCKELTIKAQEAIR